MTVKFAELGIARIRMVRGGDIWQRYRELLKMPGPSRMTSNQGNGHEDARLYLDKQRTLETGITWSTIQNLTALGHVVQHPCVDVITLSYDKSYVSYQFDENHLTITLHSASVDEYDDCAFIVEQAKQSLQWVFENFARRSCKFLSPSAKLEPTMLSNLPAVITELTLCNMSMFLAIREGLERCRWWVENFSQDLQHVRRLILVNCEYDSMDLHRLRERLKDAQIDVDGEESGADGEDKPHL